MRASRRCMRFAAAALVCNTVCLGFATGLAKAPSQVNSRSSPNGTPLRTSRGVRTLRPASRAAGFVAGARVEGGALAAAARRWFNLEAAGDGHAENEDISGATTESTDVAKVCWLSWGDLQMLTRVYVCLYVHFAPSVQEQQHHEVALRALTARKCW